ncbi:hypothetical protein ACFUEN_16450 [Streptomyces griseorubiginosus]|uniref:hypothetical protein n=1 Tax=Streptomyces griseorubiginosus TaxID=67304 RepID=UPI0036341D17
MPSTRCPAPSASARALALALARHDTPRESRVRLGHPDGQSRSPEQEGAAR